jgi:hypothetical protein
MASCSIDGSICLWEIPSFSLISKLGGHTASVKGISWDPNGNYLLSQGTDQQIIIYSRKNGDWVIETSVRELLNNSPYLDYIFAKNSWSPDGRFFSVTNASNGSLPCAIVCELNDLANQISLIGHLSSVEVAKFCPWNVGNSCLIAIASQDGWISIWNNLQERPLLVVSELFNHTIMDIIWDHDDQKNLIIYACSYDGTICKAVLSKLHFGEISLEESVPSALYKLENRLQNGSSRLISRRTESLLPSSLSKMESRDSKKRIVPQLISSGKSLGTVSSKAEPVSLSIQHKIICQNLVSRFTPLPTDELIHEDSEGKLLFEVKFSKEFYFITCVSKDSSNIIWKHTLNVEKEPIKLLSSDPYLLIVCKGGVIYTLSSRTSRRLLPKIMMTGSVSGINLTNNLLFVLDENGVYVSWNLLTREIIFKGFLTHEISGKIESISQRDGIIKIVLENNKELLLQRNDLIYEYELRNKPNVANSLDELSIVKEEEKIENIEEQMSFFLAAGNFPLYLESLIKYISMIYKKGYIKKLEEVYYEVKKMFKEFPDKLNVCLEIISEIVINDLNYYGSERISKEFFDNLPYRGE